MVSLRPISFACLGPSLGLWFQFLGELESSGGDVMALSETAALAHSCDCFTPGISRSSRGYVPEKGFQTLFTAPFGGGGVPRPGRVPIAGLSVPVGYIAPR